jgi:peptidoglycan/xylan/chitin deacetylase (PgdA/CDA1 family)
MLHLEEALEELYASGGRSKPGRDRRTPLVLTFDDGYHDNYTHAFPLARELHVPITVFLIPGYVEGGDYFWWLEGQRLVHHAQVDNVTLEGCIYHLDQAKERALLAQAIEARLRHAHSVVERKAFLAHIREMLGVLSSVVAETDRPLTWAEVREMEESNLVSFGAHTMHHPILAYLSCPEEVRREVEGCRDVLEQQLGHPVRTFAYPVGKPEHIGDIALQAVREAGYTWALTTTNDIVTPQNDPHQLPRVLGDVSGHWIVMAAVTSGVWRFFSPLWKWKTSQLEVKKTAPYVDLASRF